MLGIKLQLQHKGGEDVTWNVISFKMENRMPGMNTTRAHENKPIFVWYTHIILYGNITLFGVVADHLHPADSGVSPPP